MEDEELEDEELEDDELEELEDDELEEELLPLTGGMTSGSLPPPQAASSNDMVRASGVAENFMG